MHILVGLNDKELNIHKSLVQVMQDNIACFDIFFQPKEPQSTTADIHTFLLDEYAVNPNVLYTQARYLLSLMRSRLNNPNLLMSINVM